MEFPNRFVNAGFLYESQNNDNLIFTEYKFYSAI